MARPQSFRDLLELHERQVRDLVDGEGDAPERLWAAWVLALRHDSDVLRIVRQAAAGDPSPGVRAHMALLLVANGELSAATTLAMTDSSDLVRASACRHLARVAKAHDLRLQELLEAAMRADLSANVHSAIADALRLDASEGVWRACVARLGDPDEEVRANVIEALLRRHAAGEALSPTLKSHATIEESSRLRSTILRAWVCAEGRPGVIGALAARPVSEILRGLQFFGEEGEQLQPDSLEALLNLEEPAIDAGVAALHRLGVTQVPMRWLLEFVVRFKELPDFRWSAAVASRWDAMEVAVASLAPMLDATVDVSAGERDLIRRLRTRLEREVSETATLAKTDEDTLVRLARGELGLAACEDIDLPQGTQLLPHLRRLAHE
jgi:hypothetical protein